MSNINSGMAPLLVLANTVARTMKDMGSQECNFAHGAIGVSGEAGELSDLLKKISIYKSLDFNDPAVRRSIAYELGDLLWYIQLTAMSIDYNLDTIIDMNEEKLKLRFPEKFTVQGTIDKADKQVTGELE